MIEVRAQTDGQVEGLWEGSLADRQSERTERFSEGHTTRHLDRWQSPVCQVNRREEDRPTCWQLGKSNRDPGS